MAVADFFLHQSFCLGLEFDPRTFELPHPLRNASSFPCGEQPIHNRTVADFAFRWNGVANLARYTNVVTRLDAWRVLVVALLPLAAFAQLDCRCNASLPETLKSRECSLCTEVEKHASNEPVILVRDINPRKANRWLALPRAHGAGPHRLEELTAEQRNTLWTIAIDKAKSEWGERWAIAMNGQRVRTQCHMHVHIGRLLEGVEVPNFVTVALPDQIPLPAESGIWIHPVTNDGKQFLHVHLGEQVTETVLLR